MDAPPEVDLATPHRFFWVALPYAIYIGFVTNGAVSLLLRRAGMPVGEVADAIALLGIPSAIYFLWSPLVDLWISRRSWYLLSTVGAAVALAVGSMELGRDSRAAVWAYFVGLLLCMMISSAYGGLIASMLTSRSRTRAAAWTQASNLGGGAVGPGLILYLALRYRAAIWVPGAVAVTVLPALAVWALREPRVVRGLSLGEHWRRVGRELRATCLKPKNSFGLLLLVAPPGGGALIGLLPALSPDYGVAGTSVVWINGIGGGLLMAAGCLAGGWVPARYDRRVAYAVAGALNALPALYLMLAPATFGGYMAGTVMYLLTIGVTSTLSMDLVLDIVGAAGRSGSLRFSVLMAMSYMPTAYMTWAEGWAARRWGFRGVPGMEALSSLVDLPLIAVWMVWSRWRRPGAGGELG